MHIPPPERWRALYRQHFGGNPRRERLFLSSISFFTAFAATRGITHAIRAGVGPFHNVGVGGRHIHHLVFGIAGLLGSGYIWLLHQAPAPDRDDRISRFNAALYGAGSAVTLDEFALWLNLEDVYWARQGRVSVDAVVLFGAVLSIGLWGRPFFRDLFGEMRRI